MLRCRQYSINTEIGIKAIRHCCALTARRGCSKNDGRKPSCAWPACPAPKRVAQTDQGRCRRPRRVGCRRVFVCTQIRRGRASARASRRQRKGVMLGDDAVQPVDQCWALERDVAVSVLVPAHRKRGGLAGALAFAFGGTQLRADAVAMIGFGLIVEQTQGAHQVIKPVGRSALVTADIRHDQPLAKTYRLVGLVVPRQPTENLDHALLPILLGSGAGSEVTQRIAAPMVGGMLTAPLLSLLVIPAVYRLLGRRRLSRRRSLSPNQRSVP